MAGDFKSVQSDILTPIDGNHLSSAADVLFSLEGNHESVAADVMTIETGSWPEAASRFRFESAAVDVMTFEAFPNSLGEFLSVAVDALSGYVDPDASLLEATAVAIDVLTVHDTEIDPPPPDPEPPAPEPTVDAADCHAVSVDVLTAIPAEIRRPRRPVMIIVTKGRS